MALAHQSVSNKLQRACRAIAARHKLPPEDGETFADQNLGQLRIQDYAFTQGFAVVKTHEDNSESRKMVTLQCTRHGKKTRNTRGLTEKERKRHATHVQFLECPYKAKLRYRKREKDWKLSITSSEHSHEMLEDPFQLKEHRYRDPDRVAACAEGAALRATQTPYSAARRIMRIKGLHLSQNDYYNLVEYSKARTPAQEVQYALKTLENRGFHIRIKEKYLVEGDTRQGQEIQFFFFCNRDQILFARRYASHFLVQTDATFTTNANELPLSVIVCVTNLMRSFPIAYCFIASESADAFIFMNECMRELFFHDSCRGPAVILGDFAAGLTAAMVARRQLSIAEAGMEVAYELAARLDEAGNEVFLQLCNWHAAEAIKKRLSREGYPIDPRRELIDQIWKWIKSETMLELATNRRKLLDGLRAKEQAYFISYYQPREHQFVSAYTKLLPNLGCYSSQRSEGLHPLIKGVCNRHTPIGQSVEKITENIDELVRSHEYEINRQKTNLPRSIDMSRDAFKKISPFITHEAVELVLREWNFAKRWYEDVFEGKEEAPEAACCKKGCTQPSQYSLPCACWMYECLPRNIPIPLSLIHPRWLFRTPDIVVGWEMSVDPSIDVADYHNMTGEQNNDDNSSGDSAGEDRARSQKSGPGTPPEGSPGAASGAAALGLIPSISLSDRFENRGRALIEKNAIEAYNYHEKLPDTAARELYAAEHAKIINRLNTEFSKKYAPEEPLPKVFAKGKEEKDLKYKKGGSRRRAYTGREAAEAEEIEERRRRRHASIEANRIAQHEAILKQDEEVRQKTSALQGLINGESGESGERGEIGDIDVFVSSDDDDNIQFLGANDMQDAYQQGPEDTHPTSIPIDKGKGRADSLSSSSSSSSSGGFRDIEEILAKSKPPAPLISLSQIKSESQLPSQHKAPSSSAATGTRGARGVERKKTKTQKEKESQDRHRKEDKERRRIQTAERKVKKEAKKMLPRKDDVSQLVDKLFSSSF